MSMTEEQRARMEKMKAEALAKKRSREIQSSGPPPPVLKPKNTPPFISDSQKRLIEQKKSEALAKKGINNLQISNSLPAASFYNKTSTTPPPIRPPDPPKIFTKTETPAAPPQPRLPSWLTPNIDSKPQICSTPKFGQPSGKVVQGTCSLISTSRFEVHVGYNAQLIEIFKSIPSSQYRSNDRIWTFDLTDHDSLIQKSKSLAPGVVVTPLPAWILSTFRKFKTENLENIDISSVETHLCSQLMPFQKTGVQYAVSRGGRVLIADDMGLGKTVQALGIASYYARAWPLLIVSPSSMRFAWEAAVRRWLPSVDPQDISVITSGKDFIGKSSVIIFSYDLLSKKKEELLKKNFQLLILDESHMIKDSRSARCKAVEPLAMNTKYLILLSGTPALSRPIELYSQIHALQPRLFRNASEFGYRYCDGKVKQIGAIEIPDFSGSSHMTELSLLLQQVCMIRRLKQDVLTQLPSKQRTMVVLDPSGVASNSREMKEKKKEYERSETKGMEKKACLLEWFHASAEAKLKAVQDYLKDLLLADRKFIVFCHHQTMLLGVQSMLEKQGVGYIKVDGSVDSQARKSLVDSFQTKDSVKVAVLSITAASCGLTLTAAQLVVFAELFWNPGVLCQAEDRAHRIGQTDSVVVQYLVARGTVDDTLWPMIQNKLVVLNKAGLSKDNFEDSETKELEMENQMTIDDFFKSDEKEATAEVTDNVTVKATDDLAVDYTDDWGDLTDADLEEVCTPGSESPPAKKAKTSS